MSTSQQRWCCYSQFKLVQSKLKLTKQTLASTVCTSREFVYHHPLPLEFQPYPKTSESKFQQTHPNIRDNSKTSTTCRTNTLLTSKWRKLGVSFITPQSIFNFKVQQVGFKFDRQDISVEDDLNLVNCVRMTTNPQFIVVNSSTKYITQCKRAC